MTDPQVSRLHNTSTKGNDTLRAYVSNAYLLMTDM
jgi:hypothetical protein